MEQKHFVSIEGEVDLSKWIDAWLDTGKDLNDETLLEILKAFLVNKLTKKWCDFKNCIDENDLEHNWDRDTYMEHLGKGIYKFSSKAYEWKG